MKCAIKKCTKKTKGTCYKVLKGKVVLQGGSTTVTSAYNRGAIATGVLTDANGAALKNTDVSVSTTTKVSGKSAEVGSRHNRLKRHLGASRSGRREPRRQGHLRRHRDSPPVNERRQR